MRLGAVVVALLALTVAGRHDVQLARGPLLQPGATTLLEPPAAAAFVAAYTQGDEEAAQRVASPLYGAEWSRWGLSIRERAELLPHREAWQGTSAPWLRLSYVAGAVDGRGFGHLLYTAQPARGDTRTAPGVWRVDTDRQGRVIWSELVWHFSDRASEARPVAERRRATSTPIPIGLARRAPRVLLGIRTGVGHEGYYLVEYRTGATGDPSDDPGTAVACFGIDEEGALWPGAWSYGRAQPGRNLYDGRTPLAPRVQLAPDQAAMRAAYLADL